ncbi:MAG: sodium-coupled permease [Planctomycetes bacterium]|nr:sodium-coupled permease [Planctomycetota bacterium]
MTVLDYLVIALYAVGMLAVGKYYARRAKTSDDYLLGGRKMSPFMIGISLFATITSTLSYLAYPGEMIRHGPMLFAQLAAFPAVFFIVGWGLIPWIMGQKVTSGYELLEARLGMTGRLIGSGMFVTLRMFWMASILYATSTAVLIPLLEIDPEQAYLWAPILSTVMGTLTLIYTAEGGMRAVVMTDALQSFIMFAGGILIVIVVSVTLGGVGAWWPTTWERHWDPPVFWFDASARTTFMGAFLNMLVWMTCTAGSDQMALQRYLATRDAPAARRSFGVHLVAELILSLLLALVGLAVLGYFMHYPELLQIGESVNSTADKLLPRFIVIGLPMGITGLVIAAMLSAAMSSLSSGMNSSSAVITRDFIARFRRLETAATTEQPEKPALTQAQQVRLERTVSVVIGVIAILLSTVVGSLAGNLIELCFKVVNLLTAPLFVLFFLALFVKWSTPLGAVAATVASVSVAVGIAFFGLFGLSQLLWTAPCALVAGVLAGMIFSPLGKSARPPAAG